MSAVQWLGEPLRFQLCLEDPLQELLQSHQGWQGVQGNYVVELGQTSSATSGEDPHLPVLNCSVNALSRLLWGVVPASSLLTDNVQGDAQLLAKLDKVFVERPHPFWDF